MQKTTWRHITAPDEQEHLVDAVLARVQQVRAAAEGRTSPMPRGLQGEIWSRDSADGDIVVWALPSDGRVALLGILAPTQSATPLRAQLGELAAAAGWHGDWNFSAYAGDELMTTLAAEAEAQRIATKMQLLVAEVPEPNGIHLRAMDDADYAVYRAAADEGYAQERFASGAEPTIEEARRFAAQQMAELLPDAQRTAGHLLCTVREEPTDEQIGILWVHLRETTAFIYDIEMDERMRGRGYGTQTLRAAASETRRAGLEVLCLNVFGSNDAARRLYAREGYTEVEAMWALPIEDAR